MTSHYNPVRSNGFVVRKHQGKAAAFALFALDKLYGAMSLALPAMRRASAFLLLLILIPIIGFMLAALFGALDSGTIGTLMATPAVAAVPKKKSGTEDKNPASIRKMEADLKAIASELEQGQIEMAGGPISAERGEELEEKAKEMEDLQSHIDRYNKIAGITSRARQMERVTLPSESHIGLKRIHTTAGHLFVGSDALKVYKQQGKQGWSANVEVPTHRLNRPVKLMGEAAMEFEKKAFDPAQLSDLGTDAIIEIDRDRELIRFEEPEIFSIRDVLNSAPTTSDSIRFVRHVATTRAAASQDPKRGGLKEMLVIQFEPTTVNVETIAVLSKVTEQDIDDAPRLVGYINGEMSLDVRVVEERQLLWGTGLNAELKGLFHADYAIPEFNRAEVGDKLVDTIRRMRTDLRKNERIIPNFVTIDPIDWEEIELAKGTDERYIWGLVTDLRGPRIWSLRVVESDAMTNTTTGERRLLMGDGTRGATVYTRNAIRLAVGFMDDDFGRNLRTLRAEERVALAVKRAFAFEYVVTAEAAS